MFLDVAAALGTVRCGGVVVRTPRQLDVPSYPTLDACLQEVRADFVLLATPWSVTPGAIVEIDESGEAWLLPLQEIEVPEGRALQVWTLQDRATGPVSIGLIADARRLRLNIGKLPPTGPDQLFEITLEPETGSPTGRPTGPILFKGTTARAL